jgi:hypothetical protein
MTDALHDIFRVVADVLMPSGIDCLLIGGFAVNHYGYTRNTLDIDLMIVAEQKDDVRRAMMQAGFTNVAVHANVTFFNRPESPLRVDFLNTDRATMVKMLERATWAEFFGKKVRVPALTDLLSMKFFALAQAPGRRMDKDLPDIAWLAVVNGLDVEKDLHPLAMRFADENVFQRVCEKIKDVQK